VEAPIQQNSNVDLTANFHNSADACIFLKSVNFAWPSLRAAAVAAIEVEVVEVFPDHHEVAEVGAEVSRLHHTLPRGGESSSW
jgi:hypothetical protein